MFSHTLKIKDVKNEIGQLVRSYRKSQKLTQQQLADQLDLSRITIQNLESGKNFTIDTFLKVLQHVELLGAFNAFVKGKRSDNEHVKSLY